MGQSVLLLKKRSTPKSTFSKASQATQYFLPVFPSSIVSTPDKSHHYLVLNPGIDIAVKQVNDQINDDE